MDFFDTNILLYLISSDETKADRAEALIAGGGIVSVQVLNEFTAVAARKSGMRIEEIGEVLDAVRAACKVVPLTIETHDLARSVVQRYGYQIYDASIVASAMLAGCNQLYTEDMQSGQRISGNPGLVLCDPFR